MTKKAVDDLFDTPPELRERLVSTGDLDDLTALPGQVRALAAEVRTGFEMLGNKVLPQLERIHDAIEDIAVRVTRVEKDLASEVRERKRLAERVEALEMSRTKRKRAQKVK